MPEKGTCGKGGVGAVEESTGEKMAGGRLTMWERRQQDRYCRFAWCYWAATTDSEDDACCDKL